MARAWSPESPTMKALARVFDLILLNMLFILTSIPVVTVGASLSAMHYVLLHMARNEEGYIIKPYFKAFKDNFRQATCAWIIIMLFGGALFADYHFLDRLPEEYRSLFSGVLVAVAIVWLSTIVYIFPLIARFENSFREIMKNVFVVSLVFFVRTIAMVAILVGFGYLFYNLPLRATPVLLLFGFSFPGMLMAYLYTPILKKMEATDVTT